jgi:peptidoglycan/LPS O-acetylase OafA/YrhL
MRTEDNKMNPRKSKTDQRTDLLAIASLVLAVAIAAFLDHRYLGFYAWALVVIIAIFAYWIGVQVGKKRGPNGHPQS